MKASSSEPESDGEGSSGWREAQWDRASNMGSTKKRLFQSVKGQR
jgi:hypothetical protein